MGESRRTEVGYLPQTQTHQRPRYPFVIKVMKVYKTISPFDVFDYAIRLEGTLKIQEIACQGQA
jgi:hypothetical protein